VLWHDSATGDTGFWITNGAGTVTGYHDYGSAPTVYKIV
jgi:hypothetical protein